MVHKLVPASGRALWEGTSFLALPVLGIKLHPWQPQRLHAKQKDADADLAVVPQDSAMRF